MDVFTHFDKPTKVTVKDLMIALSKHPEDMEVRIDDADTGWHLQIEYVETSEHEDARIVIISGSYW